MVTGRLRQDVARLPVLAGVSRRKLFSCGVIESPSFTRRGVLVGAWRSLPWLLGSLDIEAFESNVIARFLDSGLT